MAECDDGLNVSIPRKPFFPIPHILVRSQKRSAAGRVLLGAFLLRREMPPRNAYRCRFWDDGCLTRGWGGKSEPDSGPELRGVDRGDGGQIQTHSGERRRIRRERLVAPLSGRKCTTTSNSIKMSSWSTIIRGATWNQPMRR